MIEFGFSPHVMKIDVEGFELEVLKGAARMLSGSHPHLIVEIHPEEARRPFSRR
jgi:FkbM family methyltransferase